jgi:mRNA-degrading endonuclease toxin of MazEF toxin-antitoxin module
LGADDSMPKAWAVNLLEVYTLPKRDLGPYVTQLTDAVMRRIDEALQLTLGIGEVLGDA